MHSGHRNTGNWALVIFSFLLTSPCACRGRSPEPAESRTAQKSSAASAAAAGDSTPKSEPLECPKFHDGKKQFQVDNEDLEEASDIAASAKNPGVFWSHNDSGGKARIFAFAKDGRDLGTYHIEGAELEDWEDMAIGPGPVAGTRYLYIGDIGANNKVRQQVTVYRIEEPDVTLEQKPKKRKLERFKRFNFVFPDQKSRDCESLMVDPRTGDVYLVTKPRHGAPVVYRSKAPLDAKRTATLEEVSTLTAISGLGSTSGTLVTSGDISADGSMILLRTYERAYLWQRQQGETVDAAFSHPPCQVPLEKEAQGESIAFAPDGKGYYSVSEGRHPKVYFYARKE